jgi:predicted small secreted protein
MLESVFIIMKNQRWQSVTMAGLLLVVIASGIACNTAHGFGKDVEKAGQEIKKGTD